jgi:hypothetical protein
MNLARADIRHYFEYSSAGIDIVEDGLQEMTFGEFLIDRSVINRQQLFCALQLQDRHPGIRLGECVAALGYLPFAEVQRHLTSWQHVPAVEA